MLKEAEALTDKLLAELVEELDLPELLLEALGTTDVRPFLSAIRRPLLSKVDARLRQVRGYTLTAGGGLAGARISRPDLLPFDARVVVATYDEQLKEHGVVVGKSVGDAPVIRLDAGREVRNLPLFEEVAAPERTIPDLVESNRSVSAVLAFNTFLDQYRRLNWLRSEVRAFPSPDNKRQAASTLESCQKYLPVLNGWREQHPEIPLELLTRHESPFWRAPINMLWRLINLDLGDAQTPGWFERGWLQALPWRYASFFRPGDPVIVSRWNGHEVVREAARLAVVHAVHEAGTIESGESVWLFHCEPVGAWRMPDWPRELSFMELLHELVPANIRLQPHHNVTDELVEQYLRVLGLPYKMVKRSDYSRVLIPTEKDLPIDRERLEMAVGKTASAMGSFRINELQIADRQNQLTFARLMAIRLRWENIPLNVVWDRWLQEQREQARQKLAARRESESTPSAVTFEHMREPVRLGASQVPVIERFPDKSAASSLSPFPQRDLQDVVPNLVRQGGLHPSVLEQLDPEVRDRARRTPGLLRPDGMKLLAAAQAHFGPEWQVVEGPVDADDRANGIESVEGFLEDLDWFLAEVADEVNCELRQSSFAIDSHHEAKR